MSTATVRYAASTEMFGYSAWEVVRDGEVVARYVFPTEGDAALNERAETFARKTATAINAR